MPRMETSSTAQIVEALTKAIVEHRLRPGTKLAEQKLADHFGVSRTLVRQALFQLSQNRLIRLEPARGAFVATPSADEARQVFAELMGNQVLAGLLRDLISRCALITLMYQSNEAAADSSDEHAAIVKALAARDEALAVQLMEQHLLNVEAGLAFDRKTPANDLSLALAR